MSVESQFGCFFVSAAQSLKNFAYVTFGVLSVMILAVFGARSGRDAPFVMLLAFLGNRERPSNVSDEKESRMGKKGRLPRSRRPFRVK